MPEEIKLPTPKTLDEAIDQAFLAGVGINVLKEELHAVIKDFMAQKISVANMRLELWRSGDARYESPEDVIKKLFIDLTKRTEGL